jgi:hypothetical protein
MSAGRCAVLLGALLAGGCATFRPPQPGVMMQAQASPTYSAEIRASLRGPQGRGRMNALVAFRRPDDLRIEVPGPAGPRLTVVASRGTVTSVFTEDRAVFTGPATADTVDAILGVALSPGEIMDLLVGRASSPSIVSARFGWGANGPDEIDARFNDGSQLRVHVRGIELGREYPEAAFRPPPHDGYRPIQADEVADILGRRR